jgi:hypothetical protein
MHTSLPVTVVNEVVPSDQKPDRFAGYVSRIMALGQALRQDDKLYAIGKDHTNRYHVLKTNITSPTFGESWSFAPAENNLFRKLALVGAPAETAEAKPLEKVSWSSQINRVKALHEAWRNGQVPTEFRQGEPAARRTESELRSHLEREYTLLLAVATGIAHDLIHISRSEGDRDSDAVNFDLGLTTAKGQQEVQIGKPLVVVGPSAFSSDSHLSVVGTVVHEIEHFAHADLALKLMKRFKGDKAKLITWLRRRLAKGKVSALEDALIEEQLDYGKMGDPVPRNARHPNTQTLAHLAGFMAIYNRMRISNTSRFNQIDHMAVFWKYADRSVRDSSIEQLKAYLTRIDEVHKTDFAKHARERQKMPGKETNRYKMFWTRVVNDVLTE